MSLERYARMNYLYICPFFIRVWVLTSRNKCLILTYPCTFLAATSQVYCFNVAPGDNLRFWQAIPDCWSKKLFEDMVIALLRPPVIPSPGRITFSPCTGFILLSESTISSKWRDEKCKESSHSFNQFLDFGHSKVFKNSNMSFSTAIWDSYWRLFFDSIFTFNFPPFHFLRLIHHPPVETRNTLQPAVSDHPKGLD
jgi:hypothetical protein